MTFEEEFKLNEPWCIYSFDGDKREILATYTNRKVSDKHLWKFRKQYPNFWVSSLPVSEYDNQNP